MSTGFTPDFSKLRLDFPMLSKQMHGKPLVYLDSAATAHKPQCVIDAMGDFYSNGYGTVNRAVYELAVNSTELFHGTRKKVAQLINAAEPEEVIFTRGTTASINLVASSFGKAFLQPGDEVLITQMEHHANIVPWQMACKERGAILKVVPINDRGELVMDEYERLLSPRTKMVGVVHLSNALGTINPIKQMIAMAHGVGACVLVDGAQSVARLPIDVQSLDADFFVFSGHKIYGPTGVGVMYGKRELLEQMPPYQGGGDMIETVTFETTTYNVIPLKFEAGTPMIAEVIGLGVALDYISAIGMKHIELHERKLTALGTELLEKIPGVRILGTARDKAAILNFVVEGVHALDIGTFLDLEGIAVRTGHHCTQPTLQHFNATASARASFGLYSSEEDLVKFHEALVRVINKLR